MIDPECPAKEENKQNKNKQTPNKTKASLRPSVGPPGERNLEEKKQCMREGKASSDGQEEHSDVEPRREACFQRQV